MPRPSRLATLTAKELTSVPAETACRMPSEPSTAAPPTSTGSDAATSEPKSSTSRIRVIGRLIASALPRSLVDRADDASASAIAPESRTVAPSTANLSSIARYESSLAASSSPARVITATALDLFLAAYCGDFADQYEAVPATADLGSLPSESLTRLASCASSMLPLAGV